MLATPSVITVSIHAPVRGATSRSAHSACVMSVSIHAPVRGATSSDGLHVEHRRFNPRARTGRDAIDMCRMLGQSIVVSIHAPVRGATVSVTDATRSSVSIHAPVRGATIDSRQTRACVSTFQSTRPYGARRSVTQHVLDIGFNPRARTGRDDTASHRRWHQHMFQSTRPYGARP